MAHRAGPLALLLVFFMAACSAHDTAERPGHQLVLQPRLALDLPMGTADSVLVDHLVDATRLSDGTLALLDEGRLSLTLLDAGGRLRTRTGRRGEGPGEFSIPSWLERCDGDSLFVWDRALDRMSVFSPTGKFVRQFRLPLASPTFLACGGRGIVVAFETQDALRVPPRSGADQPLHLGSIVVSSPEGDSIAAIPGQAIGENRVLGPLGRLAVRGEAVFVGLSSSPLVHRYSLAAESLAVDSLPLTGRPVSDSLYNAELDRVSATTGGDSAMRARIKAMLAVVPKPEIAPLYQSLHVSSDGTEWVVTSLPTDPGTVVIGRLEDGRTVRFPLPQQVDVYEIGRDYLLGKASDEDGEDHLLVYRWDAP